MCGNGYGRDLARGTCEYWEAAGVIAAQSLVSQAHN